MTDHYAKSRTTFERGLEPMPRLVPELPAAEPVLKPTHQGDVRTAWVSKLDSKTVWRVIDMLKAL